MRWRDVEPLDGGGQVTLLGKGSKVRTVRISVDTLALIESLGRQEPEDWLFPSNRRNGPMTQQGVANRMTKWGKAAGVHLWAHRCRHTHATQAIRRGADFFWCNTRWGIAPLKQPAAMSPAARPIPAHFDWAKGSGKARMQDIDCEQPNRSQKNLAISIV